MLLYGLLKSESIIGKLSALILLPNVFATITCYYLIMLFLFYTPKFIKKKWSLIVYRCCAIILTASIFISYVLFHGYNVSGR